MRVGTSSGFELKGAREVGQRLVRLAAALVEVRQQVGPAGIRGRQILGVQIGGFGGLVVLAGMQQHRPGCRTPAPCRRPRRRPSSAWPAGIRTSSFPCFCTDGSTRERSGSTTGRSTGPRRWVRTRRRRGQHPAQDHDRRRPALPHFRLPLRKRGVASGRTAIHSSSCRGPLDAGPRLMPARKGQGRRTTRGSLAEGSCRRRRRPPSGAALGRLHHFTRAPARPRLRGPSARMPESTHVGRSRRC
jgi:hypothetical protein